MRLSLPSANATTALPGPAGDSRVLLLTRTGASELRGQLQRQRVQNPRGGGDNDFAGASDAIIWALLTSDEDAASGTTVRST